MTGYVLLVIELAAILVVLVGLALFLGWVLGKRSARAKLAAEQETRPTRPTPELEAMAVLKDDEKEPVSLASRAVPVEAQPVASQPPSPIAVASTPDSRPKAEAQPVSIPSPFAPDPSLYAGPSASTDPSARGIPAEAKPAEAKPAGEPQPDLLNDHTVSDESTIDTHMIPRITGQTPPPTPTAAEPDPRLLEAESRANDAEAKAREAEARIEEANQRALEAEVKAQEAEAKIEEAGQQVTQADLRVSEAEARAAEAEARAQQVDQHISDAEQARRQVVELEERINKQEIDMARLENRATAAWDKTMPNLIERIESLEGDLSQARREAAELQALLAAERDQATPASATEQAEQAEQPEQDEQPEQPEQDERPEVPQTEIIKEEPWQAIGAGVAQETPITFAPSTPEEDAKDQDPEQLEQPEQPGEPVDEVEPQEETKDEKTPDEEAAVEEEPGDKEKLEDEEKPEVEEEVRAPEQLAPTAVVEHEVELPAPEEKTKDQEDEDQEDSQETENREEPEQEPAAQEETTDLSALTDTGSFAKLVAPGPAPEDPTPMDLPETEHLVPTAPVYPVTAHHDDATIPDIPRITAPIAQPFGTEEDTSGWRRTMTPDTSQPKATDSSSKATDLLIDETEVDEVPVVAGLPEPGPVAEPSVNEGHIVAPQFGMAGQHDGVPHSPLDPKGDQLSISLEEDYTLVDPIDESIAVMEDLGEEFPVGVGIPPEDYPRIR
ncbi:hypothetical protein QTN80_00160 [Arachnia propionica]|uniref:hypothetical protein n=1 Tax=Arachnia propionica TaxID=1750 RepID=UPI00398FC4BA